jgi:thiosulfate/3-mercaptopyruvate sulfurtransferase
VLDGGLEKWRAEGRPVSTAAEEPKPAAFTVRLRPEVVVALAEVRDASWVATNQKPATITLVDARPPAEFTGKAPGEGVPRGGHIPGASSVFWKNHLVSDANPVLRPERELRALFRGAGATDGSKVITYCRTGGQASHAYFVAKYLGYDVAMYDGSYIEWSNASDTPVVSGK